MLSILCLILAIAISAYWITNGLFPSCRWIRRLLFAEQRRPYFMLFADSISSCLTLEFPAFVIAVCRTLNPLESSPGYNPIADRKNFAKFFYWIILLKLTFKILLLKLLTAPKIRFVFTFALRFFFFASQLMCCKQCRVAQLPFLLQFHQTIKLPVLWILLCTVTYFTFFIGVFGTALLW